MLRALNKVLSGEGGTVAGAANSSVAMVYLLDSKLNFDLVITDIRMPLVDGLEVLDIVKTNRPSVPVIIITAFGSPEVKSESLRQGAAAFLEKPVDTAELLVAIEHVFAPPLA